MKLVVDAPINSLSFGNVSVNLLREMYKKQMDIALFPTGGQADLEAFDKIDKNFVDWLQKSTDNRFNKINKDVPTFKLWHINGSEKRITPKQYLYTFYELDSPTEVNAPIEACCAIPIVSNFFTLALAIVFNFFTLALVMPLIFLTDILTMLQSC